MIMMEKLDTLRGKPEELKDMKSVRQLVDDLTRANGLLWLAGTAAFLASGMFVVKYFVNSLLKSPCNIMLFIVFHSLTFFTYQQKCQH